MAVKNTDVRGKKYTTESGHPARDTKMLSGQSSRTPAESAKNDTGSKGYTGSGPGTKGKMGGKPSWE